MQATAHPAFVDKFPAEVAAVEANVVVDGRIVTGRGPAPAMEFALTLVEQLYGKDKVDEISKSVVRENVTSVLDWLNRIGETRWNSTDLISFSPPIFITKKRTCIDSFKYQFRLFHTGLF